MTPSRVLVVCTGNICRSPLAERLLRARLADAGVRGIEVGSAGTHAMVGHPMPTDAARELAAVGGDPTGHVSRQLSPDLVRDADLVVTATLAHRSDVVSLHPPALRYAFTLRELARLLDGADLGSVAAADPRGDRVRALAALAVGRRGVAPPAGPGKDDVVDPYGRRSAVYAEATTQTVPAVEALVRALATISA